MLDIRVKSAISVILALGIMATAATSVRYVNIVFNSYTRWIFLIAIFAMALFPNRLSAGLRKGSAIFGLLFISYSFLTTFWSQIPILSASKSILYLLCSLGYSAAAAIWVKKTKRQDVFYILFPLLVLTLFAGISGSFVSDSKVKMNETVSIYRGLTFNSNLLGLLILGSLPLPLWIAARPQSHKRERQLAYAVLSLLAFLLIQTVSRASILSASILVLFLLFGLGAWRAFGVLFVTTLAAMLISLFTPQHVDHLVMRFAYKGNSQNTSIMSSREDAFAASFDGAKAGGFFGVGFGVSNGYDDYRLGMGSALYGREKSNTSLAIIEELGVFGFLLFVCTMISVFNLIIESVRISISKSDRLLLFLLMGSLASLIVHSQFEAWLLSPGGALTPVFWVFIGLSTAVSLQIKREARAERLNGVHSLVSK